MFPVMTLLPSGPNTQNLPSCRSSCNTTNWRDPDTDLTDTKRQKIIDWTDAQMANLKNLYPADSFSFPKRN